MRDSDISLPAPILGVPIDPLTLDQCVNRVFKLVDEYSSHKRPHYVATVNADFLCNAHGIWYSTTSQSELLESLRRADLLTADGMPVVWLARLMGTPISERVTGADLVPRLLEEAALRGKSVYFLGGEEATTRKAVAILQARHPALTIAGVACPWIKLATEGASEEDEEIIASINQSGADILLLNLGNPKQELWFHRNRATLQAPVAIGIGGTLNFIAGDTPRAPSWMQATGLEWLFRLGAEPTRLWKRYATNLIKLPLLALPSALRQLTKRAVNGHSEGDTSTGPIRITFEHGEVEQSACLWVVPPTLSSPLPNVLQATAGRVILDFSVCTGVTEKGLSDLLLLYRRAANSRTNLDAINLSASLRRVLSNYRVLDCFTDRPSAWLRHLADNCPKTAIDLGQTNALSITLIEHLHTLSLAVGGRIRYTGLSESLSRSLKDSGIAPGSTLQEETPV